MGQRRRKNSVNFYFDEHAVVDQAPHFDHSRARFYFSEKFAVSAAILFPSRDVRDEHPRPHNVFQTRSQSGERAFDIANYLNCLSVSVSDGDDLAAFIGRGRPSDENQIADAERPRITDYRLPFRARRIILLFYHTMLRLHVI
jgi:hypothetical protein